MRVRTCEPVPAYVGERVSFFDAITNNCVFSFSVQLRRPCSKCD